MALIGIRRVEFIIQIKAAGHMIRHIVIIDLYQTTRAPAGSIKKPSPILWRTACGVRIAVHPQMLAKGRLSIHLNIVRSFKELRSITRIIIPPAIE